MCVQKSLSERLLRFESKAPELVFEWNDSLSSAKGWVVINSLRGGAAGGGTRMRQGLTMHEVLSLAKTMEVKFSVCGPDIGGAKSGIDYDPASPDKNAVLQRWYRAVYPLLKHYYGTGGDLNVDEVHEVIPITRAIGLIHPQEGIVRGHFKSDAEQVQNQLSNLSRGVVLKVGRDYYAPQQGDGYTISDMATGFGVASSVKSWYELTKGSLEGKQVLIQGWGNVASAAGWYLSKWGAKICGILDRQVGLIVAEGMDFEQVNTLFTRKKNNTLNHPDAVDFEQANAVFWDTPADVFIPAAASRLIEADQLQRLHGAGVRVIACGANVPFNDREIFYGPLCRMADEQFTLIPDFLANCGMARCFAYLMQPDAAVDESAILEDIGSTIRSALQDVVSEMENGRGLYATAISRALKKLGY